VVLWKKEEKKTYERGGDTMKDISVLLGTINDVKEFVNIVTRFDFEVDLISGRYAVDAKSIMGIFSLDLSKPITVQVHNDDRGEFLAAIEKFIVQ
jgi:phosphotransferase system HPr-like phosphotransfer protein